MRVDASTYRVAIVCDGAFDTEHCRQSSTAAKEAAAMSATRSDDDAHNRGARDKLLEYDAATAVLVTCTQG